MFWRLHRKDTPPFCAENAYSGVWGVPEAEVCPSCDGTGRFDWETCPQCNGLGRLFYPVDRGYSACCSARELYEYFTGYGFAGYRYGTSEPIPLTDDIPVVIFAGEVVGRGLEGEPLVIPKKRPRPRWITWGRVRAKFQKKRGGTSADQEYFMRSE